QAKAAQPWYRRLKTVCADMENMPFEDDSADLIYSNLALQWADAERAFAEFRRILKPGGLLMFTTFGPDSLKELRQAWAAVDQGQHVNELVDMHDLGDALIHGGFAEPVMDMEMFTLEYDNAMAVMRDLKAIGADTVHGANQGLTTPRLVRAMLAQYDTLKQGDKVPATYEVVYGHAWAPVASGAQTVQFQR
ncbi:MAG: methyltransferase domain-containing protein, partial [Gammaproteobacteria bacterium]